MRAALAEEFAGIGSVRLGERPEPAAGAGQVLVRVRGAGVGPWDVGFLSGGFPGVALPFVPGGQARDQAVGAVRDGGRAVFIVLQGTPAQLERGIAGEAFAARVTRPRLEALNRLVDSGALRPQVSAVLPLDQAREALAQVAARHVRGKIVLQVGR